MGMARQTVCGGHRKEIGQMLAEAKGWLQQGAVLCPGLDLQVSVAALPERRMYHHLSMRGIPFLYISSPVEWSQT